jgi:hypothetical protein
MAWRGLVALVTVYVALDVGSPAVPGIFSFELARLFVDSAVHVRSHDAPAHDAWDCSTGESLRDEPIGGARDAERVPVWLVLVRPILRAHHRHRSADRPAPSVSADDD